MLLKSFIWPGSTSGSRASTRRSRPSCDAEPPELIQGDYVDVLPGLLADRAEDRLTVVYQTASTGYLSSRPVRRAPRGRSSRRRPTAARSRSSPSRRFDETETEIEDGCELAIRVWPGADAFAALVDFHGNWIDWLGRMISSKDNPKLKLVRALQRKKERDETGLFACEGEDLCDAALEAGIEPVELLIAGENVEAELLAARLDAAAPAARDRRLPARPICRAALRDTCLALWQLSDPGNVGTLIRSADAFGAAVSLSDGCADPLSQKALRASAGAIFRVPLVPWAERPGRQVALAANGDVSLADADLAPPVTIVLGAERSGLTDELLAEGRPRRVDPDAGRRRVAQRRRGGAIALVRALAALSRPLGIPMHGRRS